MVSYGFFMIFPWMFPNPWISPQVVVGEIPLHESAMCSEKIGINCSCFSVEDGCPNGAGRGVPFNIPKHPKRDGVSVKMHTILKKNIYIDMYISGWCKVLSTISWNYSDFEISEMRCSGQSPEIAGTSCKSTGSPFHGPWSRLDVAFGLQYLILLSFTASHTCILACKDASSWVPGRKRGMLWDMFGEEWCC